LTKIIEDKLSEKISLATVYNTIHAFKKKGYLKEISINSDKSYFDTNTKTHHHFFDNSTKELTDISDDQVEKVKINTSLPGKKITSVEVLVRVENN
jgi:Fur family iron response transcriptional regulator